MDATIQVRTLNLEHALGLCLTLESCGYHMEDDFSWETTRVNVTSFLVPRTNQALFFSLDLSRECGISSGALSGVRVEECHKFVQDMLQYNHF